ncbi:response regulator [Candidatus Omnitrophota bacterium]
MAKKRILIVEDEEGIRHLEREILETRGYEVLEAGDVKEGLAIARKEKLDLAIIDIRLPSKKRGIGLAKILRKEEKTCDLPIIFATGYVEGEESTEVQNIPNCGYITKPFKIEEFLKYVEKYICGKNTKNI